MTATTWTMRMARIIAGDIDGGIGDAAAATIAALPPGPQRELEVATSARRIATGPRSVAFVVSPDMPDDAVEAIADLTRAVRGEMGGGAR